MLVSITAMWNFVVLRFGMRLFALECKNLTVSEPNTAKAAMRILGLLRTKA